MVAGPAAGRSFGVDSVRRRQPRSEEDGDPRDAGVLQAISGPSVHLGRHIELWLRLLWLFPNARPPPRPEYAARRAATGRLERRGAGRSEGPAARRLAIFRQFR